MLSYELVIFDCDGVLVDSEPVANRIFAEALAELGLVTSYEEVCEEFIGLTLTRCVEIVERRLGRAVPGDFVERLQRRTFDAFRRELRAVRGVADALTRIEAPVCVASSGEHEKMRLTLGLTGLLERFDGRLFSATEEAATDPHLPPTDARKFSPSAERRPDAMPTLRPRDFALLRVFDCAPPGVRHRLRKRQPEVR